MLKIATIMVAATLSGAEPTPPATTQAEVTLSPEAYATCAKQGGCVLITKMQFELFVNQAFAAGRKACNNDTR